MNCYFYREEEVSNVKHSLYMKLLVKSLFFWIGLFFVLFIFGRLLTMTSHSVHQVSQFGLYGFLAMNLLFISYPIHAYRASYEEIAFLEKNRLRKLNNVLIAFSLLNLLIGSVFLVVLAVWMDRSLPFIYNLRGLVNFGLVFLGTNVLSILIGLFFSTLVSNKMAYVWSYLTYVFFVYFAFTFPVTPLHYLLNIFDTTTIISSHLASGLIWNSLYFYKQITFIFLLFFIYQLASIVVVRKKTVLRYTLLFINAVVLFGSVGYQSSRGNFDLVAIQEAPEIAEKVTIETYTMSIATGNTFENHIAVEIKAHVSDRLTFLLDDSFEISEMTVNGQPVAFEQSGEQYVLDVSTIPLNEFTFEVRYQGSPYKIDGLGVPFVYISLDNINFPSQNIIWYPMFETSSNPIMEMAFDSPFSVYTTIDSQGHFKDGVSLFAGAYTTFEKEGIEYILPTLMTPFMQEGIYEIATDLKAEGKMFSKVIVGAIQLNTNYHIENETLILY